MAENNYNNNFLRGRPLVMQQGDNNTANILLISSMRTINELELNAIKRKINQILVHLNKIKFGETEFSNLEKVVLKTIFQKELFKLYETESKLIELLS